MVRTMQGPTVISAKEFTYGEKMTAKPHNQTCQREEGHNIRTPPVGNPCELQYGTSI